MADAPRTTSQESTTVQTIPPTIMELEKACPGASAEFMIAQMKIPGLTIEQATHAWMTQQQAEIDALKAKSDADDAAKAKAAADAEALKDMPGHSNVDDEPGQAGGGVGGGTAIEQFKALVDEEVTRNGGDRQAAVLTIDKKHPQLRIDSVNQHPQNQKLDPLAVGHRHS